MMIFSQTISFLQPTFSVSMALHTIQFRWQSALVPIDIVHDQRVFLDKHHTFWAFEKSFCQPPLPVLVFRELWNWCSDERASLDFPPNL
jgi:hypothetical protein